MVPERTPGPRQERGGTAVPRAPAEARAPRRPDEGRAGVPEAGWGIAPSGIPVVGPPWTNIGPAPITGNSTGTGNFSFSGGQEGNWSGRVTALAVDPNDATGNTVYVGAAYGGVWKTTNGNAVPHTSVTWTPLFDTDPAAATLSVGAVTALPCAGACGAHGPIILAGTGEPNNAGDSYYGQGILRFDPVADAWSLIATSDSGAHNLKGLAFSKIAFSSGNPSLVVAGAGTGPAPVGSNFGNGLTNYIQGLYFSTDSGRTWSLGSIFDPGNTPICNTGQGCAVTDVVFDATTNAFFAAVEFHGFYTSSNGSTWARVSDSGLTINTGNCPALDSFNCPMFRGQMAVQPATGDLFIVYVSGNGSATDTAPAIFRATFSGGQIQSWTSFSNNGIMNCGEGSVGNGCGASQSFYDLYIAAVPDAGGTDLYFAAVNLFKCSNPSGATPCSGTSGANAWLNITHVYSTACSSTYQTMHPDNHAFGFMVVSGNIVTYLGNDGGVYRAQNSAQLTGGATCNTGNGNPLDDLNTSSLGSLSQFIAISTHPTDATITLGGTQDNGSPAIAGSQTTPPLNPPLWFEANGGDGGYNAIDPSNPNNWYTANFDVSIQLCNQSTACIETAFFNAGSIGPAQVGGDHGAFYTPYLLDPASTSNVVVATCRVWRGPMNGTMVDLSNNFDTGTNAVCNGASNTVHGLAVGGPTSGGLSQVIYAGTDAGRIFVTTNAAGGVTSWVDRTGAIDPGGFPISSVAIDPTPALNGQTAYLTVMGFTGGGGHVWKTTNAGATWSDITGNLPDAPTDAVLVDPVNPSVIYVGSDVGVFVTSNGGAAWQEWGTGFPNVAVLSLATAPGGVLRAGTHGRGVFQINLASTPDYQLAISNSPQTVYVGNPSAVFNGTATAIAGYSSPVNLTCTNSPPSTCTPATTPTTPTSGGAAFTVTATNTSAGDFTFNVHGVGQDANHLVHDAPMTLHIVDFTAVSPNTVGSPLPIQHSESGTGTVTVTALGTFTDKVTLSCPGPLPTGMACAFPVNTTTPLAAPGTNYSVVISTTSATPVGPVAVTVNVTGSSLGAPTKAATVNVNVLPGLGFVPITPCRVADTRQGQGFTGPFGPPFLTGGAKPARGFPISASPCMPVIASGAKPAAFSLNLTVVPHGGLGFITAFPCDAAQPVASNLNSLDGRIKAVAAIVPASTVTAGSNPAGSVCVFASNDTDLVIDINGYFLAATDPSSPLAFFPVTPCRVVDTRSNSTGGPQIPANGTRTFNIQGAATPCNVPTVALAYSLNYTAVPPAALGFLTTWPTGQPQPTVSTLNSLTGTIVANAAIVPAGSPNGEINVFVNAASDVVIDINGYFAPFSTGTGGNPALSLYTLTPCRVLDTRTVGGAFSSPIDITVTGTNALGTNCGSATSALAFVLNATVVPPAGLGFLTLWPGPKATTPPVVSTLNSLDGAIASNLAIVPSTTGKISATASNTTQLVLDISGYFGP